MAEPTDAGDDATPAGWAPFEPTSPAPPQGPPPSNGGWGPPAPTPPPAGGWPPPTPPAGGWPPPTSTPQFAGAYGSPGGFGAGLRPALPKAGDARTGPLPLHPMGVGDVLDGAFKLFKANARSILLIVGAIVIPLQLLSAFLVRDQVSTGLLNVFRDPTLAHSANRGFNFGRTGGTAIVGVLSAAFIAAAVARVVAASYLGEALGPGPALRVAMRKFPALLGAWSLVHVLELLGFAFCILPGFLLMALFCLTAPAIAIEELGPIEGMRRSWRLVRPRLFPVLGIALLAGLIASFLGNLLGGVPSAVGAILGGSFAWLLVAIGGVLSELVAAPIVSIVATLLYFDGRIRQEGFDLQLMARDLRSGAGAAA